MRASDDFFFFFQKWRNENKIEENKVMDESLRSKSGLFQPFVFSAENEIVFARVRKVRERERKEKETCSR